MTQACMAVFTNEYETSIVVFTNKYEQLLILA